MKHLNIENPCSMCEHYRPSYMILHQKRYDRCADIVSEYSGERTFCDIERDELYNDISKCGSTGKMFKLASKKQRILNHIDGFLNPWNIIVVSIITGYLISFLIALF